MAKFIVEYNGVIMRFEKEVDSLDARNEIYCHECPFDSVEGCSSQCPRLDEKE